MTTEAKPKKTGRPPLPPDEKLVVVAIRMTPTHRAKLQRIGTQRMREWLDRVKE